MNDDNQPVKPPPRHSEVMSCLLMFVKIALWMIGCLVACLLLFWLLFWGTCNLLFPW